MELDDEELDEELELLDELEDEEEEEVELDEELDELLVELLELLDELDEVDDDVLLLDVDVLEEPTRAFGSRMMTSSHPLTSLPSRHADTRRSWQTVPDFPR